MVERSYHLNAEFEHGNNMDVPIVQFWSIVYTLVHPQHEWKETLCRDPLVGLATPVGTVVHPLTTTCISGHALVSMLRKVETIW